MKRRLLRVIAASLLASLMFSGCAFKTPVKATVGSTPQAIPVSKAKAAENMPAAMRKYLEMSADKLADNFGDLDLCLGDSLLFTDSRTISSETLFTFFEYLIDDNSGEYPQGYYEKWRGSDNKINIPVSDIVSILKKYFTNINFDPARIPGYNKKTGKIEDVNWGFGGNRNPKLASRKIVSNDTLKIAVKYYDDDTYSLLDYTKVYTMKFDDSGYKYLSITVK